jgi:putative molybdopterin biosynthesis protein
MRELMNTREVADYLRIRQRKVYDLVRKRSIPCTRVTGKWLFPKALVDLWVIRNSDCRPDVDAVGPLPQVIAGSHDPLLEWAVRESGCEFALLLDGSLDGLRRLAARQAMASGVHVIDPVSARYNVDLVEQILAGLQVVLIEWARREQGLIVAAGNPLGVRGMADLREKRLRFVDRQQAAGSHLLLSYLLKSLGMTRKDLHVIETTARSETDVALAVLDGKADVGLGIGAMARQFRLDFVPLHRERYDVVTTRREYFEPPFQSLLAFARSRRFAERAAELTGYDVSGIGRVVYNGP